MRTATFTHQITIGRPADRVWDLLADYGNDPSWRAGVETMNPSPPGPVRPGTTTLEVLRFGGRTYRIPGEVVEVDRGRRFAWRAAKAAGSRTVEALGPDRCRVVLEMEVVLAGAERIMAPLLVRMLDRRVASDLARLATRAAAEGGPAREATAAVAV